MLFVYIDNVVLLKSKDLYIFQVMLLAWIKWRAIMYVATILTALFVQQNVMPGFGFTSQLTSGTIIFLK